MKRTLLIILFTGCWLTGVTQTPGTDQTQQTTLFDNNPERTIPDDPIFEEAIAGGSINYQTFGKYARDDSFYAQIVERFEQADETLLLSDLFILYYGFVYRDEYNGGSEIPSWQDLAKQGHHTEAYEQVCSALKTAPASPHLLLNALQIGIKANRPDEELHRLGWRLEVSLMPISFSGDGTQERPCLVTSVTDEYVFMYNILRIKEVTEQNLEYNDNKPCDRIKVVPGNEAPFTGTEVWFDVSYPFPMKFSPKHWAKQL